MSLVQASNTQAVYTYWGMDTNMLEDRLKDLILRGAIVDSFSIGYGPSPARVAGSPYVAEATWCMMVVVRWPDGVK